jgi:8-oxo-dGTP diphosphatase
MDICKIRKSSIMNHPRVGLGVLVFNQKNQILLGARKGAHGKSSFAPPGGHLEYGESLEECAIREMLEETGLSVTNPEFIGITNDFFAAEQKHYVSIFMRVQLPSGQIITNCEPHKTEEWCWFNVNELPPNLFLPLRQLVSNNGYGNKELFSELYF